MRDLYFFQNHAAAALRVDYLHGSTFSWSSFVQLRAEGEKSSIGDGSREVTTFTIVASIRFREERMNSDESAGFPLQKP